MVREVAESELRLKADSVISEMNKVTAATSAFNTQLKDVLKYLDNIDKKSFANINTQINKTTQSLNHNIQNQNVDSYYDMGSKKRVIKSSSGAIMASDTGREKAFKDEEQAIIEETKAITEDVKERKRRRKQRADAETLTARNGSIRAAKMEDKTSQIYLENQSKIAEAKLLNAKANQIGAYLRDPKYQIGRALGSVGSRMGSIGVGSDKIEGRLVGGVLSTVGMTLKSPVAGAMAGLSSLTNGIIDLGKAATQAFAEIDSIKTQLGVVFSNQTQADTMFGQISQYAVKSPFGVQQTSELAVLLKQSGVYASDLMDTLKMLGDTASGNMEKMKRIANNYAQIVSIGKASMLDMRQFAYAGIPIFEAVSKELGVSQQELRKLISDGKVTSDIIEKVFKDLTGINGLFENATEKGAKTLKARLQNLSDAKQLAMASGGEWITNLGAQTGGDSTANIIVSSLENMYQYIHESIDTRNIEKSVKAIEDRENRINELVKLQEKYSDNPKMLALMTRALGVELSKRDKDSDRAKFEASYQNKTKTISNTYKDFGVENFEQLESLSKLISSSGKMKYQSVGAGSKSNWGLSALKKTMDSEADKLGLDLKELYSMPKDEFNTLAAAIKEAVDVIRQSKDITELEMKYHLESNTLKAQQLAFDQENKRAGQSNSLNSKFQELLEVYKSSDEYKQKEEEKRITTLNEAKEILKQLKLKASDTGSVDLTKFSMGEFLKYDAQGAFSATRKLDVVNDNNPPNPEDVDLLRTQFTYAMNEAIKRANFYQDTRTADKLEAELATLNENLDDTSYLDKFSGTLDSVKTILSGSQIPSQLKSQILNFIGASTLSHELTVGGENADLSDKNKGKELADFTPLWKRIIASATGWSADNITSSKKFMEEYQKYSAQQVSRGGIQGLANAGGRAGEIGLLLSYSDKMNNQGVKQVDWEKTEKNIYNYALSLETPLKKASATMNGLADAMKTQVQTYRKLTADLYTVGEDWATINNDIKGQYKTAQGLGNADVLDNAFQTYAKESEKYKLSYDEEKGLVVYDKLGDKIVGAIDELKGNGEIDDSELKAFLNNVKIDNLITILDKAAEATENNAVVTELNASMLSIANQIEEKRLENAAEIYGQSALVLGFLKERPDLQGVEKLRSKNDGSAGYEAGKLVNQAFAEILKKVATLDVKDLAKDKQIKDVFKYKDDKELDNIVTTLREMNITDFSIENLRNLVDILIGNFPEAIQRIINIANDTAVKQKQDNLLSLADQTLRDTPLSIKGGFKNEWWGNDKNHSNFEHSIMSSLGQSNVAFDDYSKTLTESILGNPSENQEVIDLYVREFKIALGELNEAKEESLQLSHEEIVAYGDSVKKLLNNGDLNGALELFEKLGLSADFWSKASNGANKLALSLGNIGTTLDTILQSGEQMAEQFASNAISSSMETWGKTLMTAADDSKELGKNLAEMSAGLLKNMGSMITQAGLSLAISSVGNKAGVLAGLAIAAAGGGLSFLGGMIDGQLEDNDNKEDDKYQKLLQIKQDLSDLLKQAREDAIYYENTVRHKKAISANDNFTKTKSVNDAIITPRGDVVTTDPKDYLIATKTPRTLAGGGSPTINFSVVDKSTGIKVTQQRSTYDEATNTIAFEAIIESKIQEVIATSKGDEAFNARAARLNGRTVIA